MKVGDCMIEKELVKLCAPTLAGIKTANLFSIKNDYSELLDEVRRLNQILTKKGLRLIPVKKTDKNILLYLYRPEQLKQDLSDPEAINILEEKGYPCSNPDCCLVNLIMHLKKDKDFPHEIGLFLGYPPTDVKGFIKSPCEGVKCSGCWKVYGNVCEVKKIFASYKKCTKLYCNAIQKGKRFEDLIVDTLKNTA